MISSQSSAHYVSVLCLVLSDPQSRAVYDIFGKKGLEVEGWEVRLENHRNERSEIPNCRNGCMGCKWLSALGFFFFKFIYFLFRWWRGRRRLRRSGRNTSACRGREMRGGYNRGPTPRSSSSSLFLLKFSVTFLEKARLARFQLWIFLL